MVLSGPPSPANIREGSSPSLLKGYNPEALKQLYSTILYPLSGSNYQTWFLDSGDPTPKSNGFEPSSGWRRPLISPFDVASESGVPSCGYDLIIYTPDDTSVSYDNAFFETDYYAGLVRFEQGNKKKELIGSPYLCPKLFVVPSKHKF